MEISAPRRTTLLRRRGKTASRRSVTTGTALFALVGLYVALVPSVHVLPGVELYNEKRLFQLVVLVGGAALLLASRQLREGWLQTFREVPFAGRAGLGFVAGLGILSAVQAPLPGYALLEVGHFALLFVLLLAVVHFFRRHPAERDGLMMGLIALSAFLYTVTFFVGYADHLWSGVALLWPSAVTGFDNIRFFNHYQTWTLPLIAVAPALLGGRSRPLRAGLYVLASVWWMLLLASGGRGAFVGIGVAAAGVLLLFGRAAWPWLKRQAATCAAGGALFVLCFRVFITTQSAHESLAERDLDAGGRLEAWGDALRMMTESPLLGAGPMHYAYHPFGTIWGHPHNALLQWGAEWGALSLLLVLGLVLWAGSAWMRQAQCEVSGTGRREVSGSPRALVRVAVTAALLAGAAHALVSGVLVMPLSQLLMVLIVGWAWSLASGGLFSFKHSSVRSHAVLAAAVVLALGLVAGGAWQDATALPEERAAFIEEHDARRLHPRYWQQGFFGY